MGIDDIPFRREENLFTDRELVTIFNGILNLRNINRESFWNISRFVSDLENIEEQGKDCEQNYFTVVVKNFSKMF